ncbi:hypothetical protein F441_19826 [Phytophthora nicotianae CJ01A1]|nr:hypothetical protein F443_19969 [Phytophthora nicotianae P1569]ETK73690.1 hypothetical protein L915_19415 [Phytophthora nicotianae]ETO62111.1 hypothetical protein F444_19959 [Phytophthora nicotianae P1976]ETP03195.1 hypothetical protein F441_19826 [Phytophthora nicotianae CJ01A1]ETP31369.1 hypothetical protein F442_19771 [Phytophthora nicotianae P10297]
MTVERIAQRDKAFYACRHMRACMRNQSLPLR